MPNMVIPGTKVTTDTLNPLGVMYTHSAQTVTGVKTFQAPPKALSDPTDDNHLTRKAYVDTQISNALGLSKLSDWQNSVLSRTQTDPPASPSQGDRYLIPSGATGDWSGHDGQIAEWDGSQWTYTTPNKGFAVFVEDEARLLIYDGTNWVYLESVLNHSNLTISATADDHPLYVPTDGSRGFTAPVAGVDPTQSSHLATKSYVDSVAGGGGVPFTVLDPATDDIKTALEGASDGDVFYIKPGTYSTTYITISAKITIWASRDFTLQLSPSANKGGIRITDTGDLLAYDFNIEVSPTDIGTSVIQVYQYGNVKLKHIKITGISGAFTPYYVFEVSNAYKGYLIAEQCIFTGTFQQYGIRGYATTGAIRIVKCLIDGLEFDVYRGDRVTIEGCIFLNSSTNAIASNTEGFVITKSLFVGTQPTDAITVHGTSQVEGNTIIMGATYRAITTNGKTIVANNQIVAQDDGIFIQDNEGSSIVGNRIILEGTSGRGIHAYSTYGALIAHNVVECNGSNTEAAIEISGSGGGENAIIGNYILGDNLTATSKRAIFVSDNTENVIAHNTIRGNSFTEGIYINYSRCTVEGNKLYIKNITGSANGIHVTPGTDEVVIANNTITHGNGTAIYVQGYETVIKGNLITTDSDTDTTGIDIPNTTGGNIVEGNKIRIISGYAINIAPSIQNTIVKNNIYHGNVTLPTDGVNGNIVKDNISI